MCAVVAGAALWAVLPSDRASAAVVTYREIFGNTSTNPIGSAGWQGHVGATATASATSSPNTTFGTSSDWFLSGGDGDNRGLDYVNNDNNADPDGSPNITGSLTKGYAAYTGTDKIGLVWTNEYTVDRSVDEVDTVSFILSNDNANTGDTFHLAVQIGANWYVTTSSVSHAGGNQSLLSGGQLRSFTFDPSAPAWRDLSFTPGSQLALTSDPSLASPTSSTAGGDLPAGNIAAFGLFHDATTGRSRFDSFEITQVPEPSALCLAGLVGAGLLMRRR